MGADEKLSVVVSVRFTEQEAAGLRELANGRPVSRLVRELAVDGLHPHESVGQSPTAWSLMASSAPANDRLLVTTNLASSTPQPGGIAVPSR